MHWAQAASFWLFLDLLNFLWPIRHFSTENGLSFRQSSIVNHCIVFTVHRCSEGEMLFAFCCSKENCLKSGKLLTIINLALFMIICFWTKVRFDECTASRIIVHEITTVQFARNTVATAPFVRHYGIGVSVSKQFSTHGNYQQWVLHCTDKLLTHCIEVNVKLSELGVA